MNTNPCPFVKLALALTAGGLALNLAHAATPDIYSKRWRDPAVNERIARNIEQNRKGNAVIEVIDAAGKPLSGAKVEISQTGHEFLFGCNAFVLGQLPTPEANQRYEEAFLKLFNFATVPLYWEGTEPERGELRYAEGSRDMWRRPPADRFLPWAAKNGVTLKGHPLLWHAYNPAWLPKDPIELRGLYQKRFKEIASRYAGKIGIFDVVNESLVCRKDYPLFSEDRDYVRWAFSEAAPLFPETTTLMINEVTAYNIPAAETNAYLAQVKKLLADGAKVRGIGLQYHYFRREKLDSYLTSESCDPVKLLDLYDQFSAFRLPLYITEVTIPSAGPDGEALQAEVVRDHYRLWFSAPAMAGVTWWNLGDGTAVKGENEAMGGLADADLKPKAAYRALDDLIHKEWTTQAKSETDASGKAPFRGFFGKYRVKVSTPAGAREFDIIHSRSGEHSYRLSLAP